ncbi:hypothetical protein K144316041_p21600 (plasmid) [Clostridium tetani]|uniref:hypothetical protein n=1 Tax=Clostridium tetani TaxID=1513 RepID=UPI002953727B|nr:hypothetical protein [Clostridium tetani]BDR74321.1 hypothetical protein K144316041_p21600 [Clostridium tetani]
MKKLTIIKCKYGSSEIPVLQFNYHDEGVIPTYDIGKGHINIEAMKRLQYAIENNFKIDFKKV